jgi:hypothetical protein
MKEILALRVHELISVLESLAQIRSPNSISSELREE